MTKTWALMLLKQPYYTNATSIPYPQLTEREAHAACNSLLSFYSGLAYLPPDVSLIVRRVVQNIVDPISRFQWVSQYSNLMHSRITGESNIDYCTECAQNAMQELGAGEWMVVSPNDAVVAEMECWDD